jgi:hypothetical protein
VYTKREVFHREGSTVFSEDSLEIGMRQKSKDLREDQLVSTMFLVMKLGSNCWPLLLLSLCRRLYYSLWLWLPRPKRHYPLNGKP